jgi:hypothetical protein
VRDSFADLAVHWVFKPQGRSGRAIEKRGTIA